MKIIKLSIFFLFAVSLNGQSVANRFRVPIYLTPSITLGYDSNFLRLSEIDKADASSKPSMLGDSKTFDSEVIRPELRFQYSPVFSTKHKTNLIINAASVVFKQSKNKSYSSYGVRFEQHLGPYQWFKIGYSLLPELLLRYYDDRDIISTQLIPCSFSNETIYLSYSYPIIKKTWLRLKGTKNNQYYNEHFTEFDTDIYSGELRLTTSYFRKNKFIIFFENGIGTNISYNAGLLTTKLDRSNKFIQFGGFWIYYPSKFLKSAILYFTDNQRTYLGEDIHDPLHGGREHEDIQVQIRLKKGLTPNFDIELRSKFRARNVFSEFEWVEELKSFNKYEFSIKISYSKTLDIFY